MLVGISPRIWKRASGRDNWVCHYCRVYSVSILIKQIKYSIIDKSKLPKFKTTENQLVGIVVRTRKLLSNNKLIDYL